MRLIGLILLMGLAGAGITKVYLNQLDLQRAAYETRVASLGLKINDLEESVKQWEGKDQVLINKTLLAEINQIKSIFNSLGTDYEKLLEIKFKTKKTEKMDSAFASSLGWVGKMEYASASAQLKILEKLMAEAQAELEKSVAVPMEIKESNVAPTSGASKQTVVLDNGEKFVVSLIAADLKTNKVVVDTASKEDCKNNCPVLPLAEMAARSGAWAAINGPYFCPETYPSCVDKKNSFDTLLMNKEKKYFNSDNNVYSTVPVVAWTTNARFMEKSLEWGRDTSPDAVIAGQPLLVWDGKSRFGGDGDEKKTSQGTRAFLGASGNTVYIGVVYKANVAQVSQVLAKMGILYAINLDSGGSIAFWNNGRYLAGPGRNLPFGIMLVKR